MKLSPGRMAKGVLVLSLLILLMPSQAHAYLDPGTGSYVVQLLVGGLLGGLFALGMFWRRVVAFIKHLFKRGGSNHG